MNAPVKINPEPKPLDPFYTLRDDLARTHPPANGYERILLTAAAQAWQRLQHAQDLERRVSERTGPLELFSAQREAFHTLTHHVMSCERAWRQALGQLERAQRTRAGLAFRSPHPLPRPRSSELRNKANVNVSALSA